MATIEDFAKLDIRVGEIVSAQHFEQARKPAYKLWVNLGDELGVRTSSAQITRLYTPAQLVGRQVLAVVNLPAMRVAGFESQVLVLGVYSSQGVVLVAPSQPVLPGDKLG